jgi:hypothetical protein
MKFRKFLEQVFLTQETKKKLSHYEKLLPLKDELKSVKKTLQTYKDHYESYRHLEHSIIDQEEVIDTLKEMPTQYKKTLIQMFAILKHIVVARSVKIMDKLDHVFYVNGAMGMLDMIQKYISETK